MIKILLTKKTVFLKTNKHDPNKQNFDKEDCIDKK